MRRVVCPRTREIRPLLAESPADSLDADHAAVAAVGNFAAHPKRSRHAGEVIDVELGQAEWLVDTLLES